MRAFAVAEALRRAKEAMAKRAYRFMTGLVLVLAKTRKLGEGARDVRAVLNIEDNKMRLKALF